MDDTLVLANLRIVLSGYCLVYVLPKRAQSKYYLKVVGRMHAESLGHGQVQEKHRGNI